MIKSTQLFTEFCREVYRQKTNTNYTPFINVLHDCWTKSNAEIIGVSICFIDPKKFVLFRLVVGLQEIKTKNSEEVARAINNILGRLERYKRQRNSGKTCWAINIRGAITYGFHLNMHYAFR
jgi:hypothetical protein